MLGMKFTENKVNKSVWAELAPFEHFALSLPGFWHRPRWLHVIPARRYRIWSLYLILFH